MREIMAKCAHIKCTECETAYRLIGETEDDIWAEAERLGWSTDRQIDVQGVIVGKCPEHAEAAALALPWKWVDEDAEWEGTKDHCPDWYLEDANGKVLMWASCPSGDVRDMKIGFEPGVREFIEKACNGHVRLKAENEKLRFELENYFPSHGVV